MADVICSSWFGQKNRSYNENLLSKEMTLKLQYQVILELKEDLQPNIMLMKLHEIASGVDYSEFNISSCDQLGASEATVSESFKRLMTSKKDTYFKSLEPHLLI